tara:strand:+ start:757 stop:981 length:225 start_codon:yes stop_codon:yes gene_type:complete
MHHVAEELKLRQEKNKIFKARTIDFDHYFKYSGKEEKVNLKIAYLIEKEKRHRLKFAWGIKNDMSKYKLNNNGK